MPAGHLSAGQWQRICPGIRTSCRTTPVRRELTPTFVHVDRVQRLAASATWDDDDDDVAGETGMRVARGSEGVVHLWLAREAVAPSLPAPFCGAQRAVPCTRGDCGGSSTSSTENGDAGPGSGDSDGGGLCTATEAALPAAVDAEQRLAAAEQRSSYMDVAGPSLERQARSSPPAAEQTAAEVAAAQTSVNTARKTVIGQPAPAGVWGFIDAGSHFQVRAREVRALFPAATTEAQLPFRFTFAIGCPNKVGPVSCSPQHCAFIRTLRGIMHCMHFHNTQPTAVTS